jgi:N-acetylglucosaminyl-diphospho-decaprenol L-rhamnosyltransferase
MPQCTVDVLIVSFNTRNELATTVDSLIKSPGPHGVDVNVSVFDNGSTDGSPDMLSRDYPMVSVCRGSHNIGFGRANNELARRSAADYILLLNSDVIVTEDLVGPLIDVLASDPQAVVAGPRLVYPDGQVQYSAQRFPSLAFEIAVVLNGTRFGRLMTRCFDSAKCVERTHETSLTAARVEGRRPDFLWATCWLMRRADIVSYDLFDVTFPMYDEDLDFCKRMRAHGRTLRYVPSVELVHVGGASSPPRRKRKLMRKARLRYYRRHHGRLTAMGFLLVVPLIRALALVVEVFPVPHDVRVPSAD